jgi:hypothetical protein
MGLDTKTYWLTDRQSQCDFDFHLRRIESSFEKPACRDMSLGAEEFNWDGSCRIMARKELGGEKIFHVWFEVAVRLLQIRCQDTTSEDWEP